MSVVSAFVEAASEQDVTVGAERFSKSTASLLLASDACCRVEHVIAELERTGGEMLAWKVGEL